MRKHAGDELSADLAVAVAMAAALEDYLFSDRLFYQLVVHTPQGDRQPKLTISGFLECLRQLEWGEDELDLAGREKLAEIREAYADVKRRWSDRFAEKARQELNSRLDSWRWFMQDCVEGQPRCQSEYASEVWIRTRVAWLMDELAGEDLDEERNRLALLDAQLSRVFRAGAFIWDPALASHFPRADYWWLHGRPEILED